MCSCPTSRLSNATLNRREKPAARHGVDHSASHRLRLTSGVDHDPTLLLGARHLEVAPADALMEGPGLRFQAVVSAAIAGSLESDFDRKIEKQRQVRNEPPRRRLRDGENLRHRKAAAMPLIRQGRVGVAVANDHAVGLEGRPDHFGHMLGAVGEVEQQLGTARDGGALLFEQQAADRAAQIGASRLLSENGVGTEGLGEVRGLGALATALDTFEGDEWHETDCSNPRFLDRLGPAA